ncbi:MAG: PTS sugar transporter subunit IIA [Pseudomonadota bacterium]
MHGILIVTHGDVGAALLRCAESILGQVEGVRAVTINANDNHDEALQRIRDAMTELGENSGVLVLTDMFGGTPSNVSLTLLEPTRVEVVSGVNMPMLLHALNQRARVESLAALAQSTAASGRKNVVIAGELLGESGETKAS